MAARSPEINLDASLQKLYEWLSRWRTSEFDVSADSKKHRGLAGRLLSVAELLARDEWMFLEERFNENPPPEVGIDGSPVPYPFDNAGRYKGVCWALKELAELAERMADENPKPRTKPELAIAADYFLHLWMEAGKDKPTMYNESPAVCAFSGVLQQGGYQLSAERVRGILTEAFAKFDPTYCQDLDQLRRLMVFRQ